MRYGELYINGAEASETWGVFLSDGALSTLMTPPPMKEYISNSSRAANGKMVLFGSTAIDGRDLSLVIYLKAASREEFFARYEAFCNELSCGIFEIKTMYQPEITYRCIYLNCTQFSQYNGRLGKFILRLNEPDPTNRY